GDFFKALSITLSVAVLISLVLSLTLIPLLARAAERRVRRSVETHEEHRGRIDRWYAATLPGFLRRPVFVGLIALILAGAGVLTYMNIGTGFLPAADEGGFVIDYLTPPGMALEDTNARLQKVGEVLTKTPEVATYLQRTGSEMGMFATQQNSGDVLVRLKPRSQRSRSSEEVI